MKLLQHVLALSFMAIAVVNLDASEDKLKIIRDHTKEENNKLIDAINNAQKKRSQAKEQFAKEASEHKERKREKKVDTNANLDMQSEQDDSQSRLNRILNDEENEQRETDLQKISGSCESSSTEALASNLQITVDNANDQEDTNSVTSSFTDNLPTNPNSKETTTEENDDQEDDSITFDFADKLSDEKTKKPLTNNYDGTTDYIDTDAAKTISKASNKNSKKSFTTINYIRQKFGLPLAQPTIDADQTDERETSTDTDSITRKFGSDDNVSAQEPLTSLIATITGLAAWTKNNGIYMYQQGSKMSAPLWKLLGYGQNAERTDTQSASKKQK